MTACRVFDDRSLMTRDIRTFRPTWHTAWSACRVKKNSNDGTWDNRTSLFSSKTVQIVPHQERVRWVHAPIATGPQRSHVDAVKIGVKLCVHAGEAPVLESYSFPQTTATFTRQLCAVCFQVRLKEAITWTINAQRTLLKVTVWKVTGLSSKGVQDLHSHSVTVVKYIYGL